MSTYKLTYFDYRAMAEPIRFLLSYAGKTFEDVRVTEEEWPEIKNNFPLAQLPVLEVDGKLYHQSTAIVRFLAKKFNLNGKDEFEDIQIDIAYETISDLRTEMAEASYEKNEEVKKSKYVELLKEKIPFLLEKLDGFVKENNGHFALGRLTWVDLYFVAISEYLSFLATKDIFEGHPNLTALKTKVLEIESIKNWVAKRPVNEC